MIEPLVLLNYPLDIKILWRDAENARTTSEPYGNDPRYPNQHHDQWLISRHTSEYINQIMEDFEVTGKPRFYWLMPNAHLPEHIDYNTKCSINFILSDDEAPVTIEGRDYFYKQALLNTTRPHSVTNGKSLRLLLKISLFDEAFEDLAKRIKYKK